MLVSIIYQFWKEAVGEDYLQAKCKGNQEFHSKGGRTASK